MVNSKAVEVWTIKPKYEIERHTKLHNMAATVAHTLWLKKDTDLVIDTKYERTVCRKSDGALLAHQDKNDPALHEGFRREPLGSWSRTRAVAGRGGWFHSSSMVSAAAGTHEARKGGCHRGRCTRPAEQGDLLP